MTDAFLPYGRHQIDEDDIAAVVDVLRHGVLTCGPKVEAFEKAFAEKIGVPEAVVCSNGTTALHLAAIVAGLGPGDKAIVPAITFLATANAVRMTGADVVFADVDPNTGLMTPETMQAAIAKGGNAVKAVMPVHMNGQMGDMEALRSLTEERELQLISDCCHALGAKYNGGGVPGDGRFEDLGCFSLHPVKSIAMGEGGMVTTRDSGVAARLRLLRGQGMERGQNGWARPELAFDQNGDPNPWYYEMQELAYNYRATDLQCALGLSQLGKLDRFVSRRVEIAGLYDELLAPLAPRLKPVPRSSFGQSAWHLYPVLIDFEAVGQDRAAVMKALVEYGVGTQVHYEPVAWQPYYRGLYGDMPLPGAAHYYARVLSLPIFPAMSDEDVKRVADALDAVLKS
ncbi:UDP-4-amino-4,6-dideoxy-N-acetyl-beta-L-altrosamine transaminase [Kordiimonas marina]|uniref:UDP-4-amino-4, 6-dideoxy-N-acetyl-beta-L-altrosamine transaminase n=1 Tax=Kordiimonas marina TaxID=2872312 RepID=UPI001FF5318E|nr:UDP-4-amino-4,6-dideoxy-N-acetyl-beta-L-altrosamine transaminase [Kordiimonas marina]MCJ9430330.1 UDP-4-amino-4,6-dideoxy-N-acetyl-beta-L-altrosamine transaminase [Kordiimonas marina]